MKSEMRVLLIEDDPDDILAVEEMLGGDPTDERRFMLACGDTLDRGLKLLAEESFDLVLLDLNLPGSAGIETFLSVTSAKPGLPIVILTGLQDQLLALEAIGLGAQDYLVKGQFDKRLLRRSLQFAAERFEMTARYEGLVRDAADPMVVVDLAGKVLYLNPAAERFFSRPTHEWLGRPFGFAAEPGKPIEVRLEDGGGERIGEMRVTETAWKRQPARLACVRDVTGLRRLEQLKAEIKERRRHDRMKDDFVGTVSHELRTPLTVMKATSFALLKGMAGPLNELQTRLLGLLEANINRLTKVSENLLDLVRLESEGSKANQTRVDIGELMRQSALGFELTCRERNVSLVTDIPVPLASVFSDPDMVHQVLFNLFDNALRFCKSTISIRARALALAPDLPDRKPGNGDPSLHLGGWVQVTIGDDGPGIPANEQAHLFTKFVQVVRPVGGEFYKGTGLGLFLCKEMVEKNGGRIWVESEVGKGTRMHFILPQPAAVADRPTAAAGQ